MATIVSTDPDVYSKFSYHIIVDIGCTKQLNLFLAKEMNLLYNKLTDTNQNIFDLGVYKGDNSSLRLPLCYKINKQNKLDKRPFIIGENSQFKNFIISDISTCTLMFNNLIHLDTAFPIDPAHFVDKYSKL